MERITAAAGGTLLAVLALGITACASQRASDQHTLGLQRHPQVSKSFGDPHQLPPPALCLAGTQGCLAAYAEPPHLCPAAGPTKHCPVNGALMRADLASR